MTKKVLAREASKTTMKQLVLIPICPVKDAEGIVHDVFPGFDLLTSHQSLRSADKCRLFNVVSAIIP